MYVSPHSSPLAAAGCGWALQIKMYDMAGITGRPAFILSTQASALADKRRRPEKIEKSKSRKVEKLSTFRLFDFSTFRVSPGLFGTFRLFVAFRAFRLFGACALFKIFLHFSTFRTFRAHPPQDLSGLFDFSWLFGLFDFSGLVHFSRFFCTFQLFELFGLIPVSPSDDTHTHTS